MADFSLIPERQLLFSPQLAATIGLEEAILLQHLQHSFDHQQPQVRRGYAWLRIELAYLLRTLPFWDTEDLHRISRSLADKGVILLESPPLLVTDHLLFAVNEQVPSGNTIAAFHAAPLSAMPAAVPATTPAAATVTTPAAASAPAAAPAPATAIAETLPTRRSAGLLPTNWSPSEDLLQLLALNQNIPRQFALGQVEDFIFYWRERGETSHAWENKFRQLVLNAWRRHQQREQAFQVPEVTPLDNHWRPSFDAMEIMARSAIALDFIEQAIPEFILYWRERGSNPKELNHRFIQHIRLQWAKYSSGLEHSTEPKRITEQWRPAEDVFDILRLSHIDADFARSLLPEFIVYWRDSNQAHTSWNSKYITHVKYHWAKRHQLEQAGQPYGGQQGHTTSRTRDRSLEQDLTDTSRVGRTEARGRLATETHVEALNQVFALFRLNYHNQYYAAFPDAEQLGQIKKLWLESLADYPVEHILRGAKHAIENSEFLPTLNRMLECCQQGLAELGLPSPHDAYVEACRAASPKSAQPWSHPAVYLAGRDSDWFFLSNNTERVSWPVFKGHYEKYCAQVLRGESLQVPAPAAFERKTCQAASREEQLARLHELREQTGL